MPIVPMKLDGAGKMDLPKIPTTSAGIPTVQCLVIGPYLPSKGGYRDNLVVTALPLPDRSAPSSLPGTVQG
jgi:hypothetical protein